MTETPWTEITINLNTITLGEMAATEEASGRDFTALLRAGKATRQLVGLFIHELRTSAQPRSWRELGDLRPLDGPSSISPSQPAGRQKASRG